MALHLDPHPSFTGRPGPLLIVVADGVGIAPEGPSNAVTVADTPTLDALNASALATEIAAHGPAVGLPSDDDMGNSEVGHNALGAGRIFAQGAKLVNAAIENGSIFESEVWRKAIEHGRDGTLHFLGLHSDGNVHAHINHLYAMLRRAADEGVTSVAVHILHDGRDVAARSALDYIEQTEAVLAELNDADPERDYRIASGGGRMTITMDRYEADWSMVERGYHCHTHGVGQPFESAAEAVETMYADADEQGLSTGDQYLGEFVVVDDEGTPVGVMDDGDAVILFNFRGDRAIEISRAYEEADFDVFDRDDRDDDTTTPTTAQCGPTPRSTSPACSSTTAMRSSPRTTWSTRPSSNARWASTCAPRVSAASPSARRRSSGTSPTSGTAIGPATSTTRSRPTSRSPPTTSSSTRHRR